VKYICSCGTALTLCLLVAAGGCQKAVYRAANLPPELSASKIEGLHKVDLSRLAQSSTSSEVIYPGDVVEVTIATGLEDRSPPSWPLRVADTGEVNIPLVGLVRVGGLLLTDAEQVIRHESIARRVFRDPHVSLLLKNRRSVRVTIVGGVTNPGTYELPSASQDLLTALIAAGGLTKRASTIVEIRNLQDPDDLASSYNGQRSTVLQNDSVRIDLIAASEGLMPEYRIRDGSIIVVREQEPTTIQVIGLVRRPNQFEVPPDQQVRLLDAVALAGGLTLELADKVQVIRQLDSMEEPVVISASIRAAKRGGQANLVLAPGDVVSVEETPLTFTVGTIQNFVRFGFSSAIPGI
jgi:polysaccharide biosynthesis/export protein